MKPQIQKNTKSKFTTIKHKISFSINSFEINNEAKLIELTRKAILFILIISSQTLFGQEDFKNYGNIQVHGSNLSFFGDLTNDGSFSGTAGNVYFSGVSLQNINGNSSLELYNVKFNNTSNFKVDNELKLSNELSFINGIIHLDRSDFNTEFIHFLDNSTYVGANDTRFVDGVVKKTGNDAFTFPVGNTDQIQAISISAPGSVTDAFTSYYLEENVNSLYDVSTKSATCFTPTSNISTCEYWRLERTNGTSVTEVDLSWDPNSCGVTEPCELVVSRWSGSEWQSEGNGGVNIISGPATSGELKSGGGCGSCGTSNSVSSYGYFTLGSLTNNNTLPVELVSFEAEANIAQRNVLVSWKTMTEINNDYFMVEKSLDQKNWEYVGVKNGAGNSLEPLYYSLYDDNPYPGTSYYRLKQLDFDGKFEYAEIRSVFFDLNTASPKIALYPNPTENIAFINSNIPISSITLYDLKGVILYEKSYKNMPNNQKLNLQNLTKGIYLVLIILKSGKIENLKLIHK